MTHDAGGAEMVAAFTRVLGHYDRMERASKSQWMARVVGDIRERRADLAVSLRLVVKIVQLEYPEAAEDLLGSDDTDGVKGKKARRRRLQERQQQITVSPDDQDYKEIRRLWIERLIAGEDLLEEVAHSVGLVLCGKTQHSVQHGADLTHLHTLEM